MRPTALFLLIPLLTGCPWISEGEHWEAREGLLDDTGSPSVDADGDGYAAGVDCDDGSAAVFPGADELCNGIDDDCDGETDEDDAVDAEPWFADTDGDGYGDAGSSTTACEQPSGHVSDDTDCDDSDAAVFPGADEYCNGVDDDCDTETDELDALDIVVWYGDGDGDGYGVSEDLQIACDQPKGYVEADGDCDDADKAVNPSASELCDGIDNDCDDLADEDDATDAPTWYADSDSDSYGDATSSTSACGQPSGYVADDTDCDDGDTSVNPGATELCDGADNDCDGDIDEDDAADASTWYDDGDGDGYGTDAVTAVACTQPTGFAGSADDCDDGDASIHPGADEYCNGDDDDCDGTLDEPEAIDATDWYSDADTDGYGDPSTLERSCYAGSGHVTDHTDCDDTDAAINPSADEHCDGVDEDCDGDIDEDDAIDVITWYADTDGDSFGDASVTDIDCEQPTGFVADSSDCDDSQASTNPSADEYCDSVDNDCDGDTDEDDAIDALTWYRDADADGWGADSDTDVACSQPSGYDADGGDCDDGDTTVNPGADEHCDGADNDCDGDVDEDDAVDALTWYLDGDLDGWGLSTSTQVRCQQPSGYAADAGDCDDGDDHVHPGADEYCDGIDTDCDGALDEDDAIDATTWWIDGDADGWGTSTGATTACAQPSGTVAATVDEDCDDGDGTINPGATDQGLNGIDEDCDGYDESQLGLGSAHTVVDGASNGDRLGWSVSSAGDLDNDGFDDIMVGAPGADGGAGAVLVFYGPTDPGSFDLGEADDIITGDSGSRLGSAIASIGDVNADGYGDILLGASGQSSNAGMAYLIHGPITSDRAGDLKTASFGGGTAHQLGDFVGGGDDVDGDGFADLLIGAPLQDDGYTEGGRLYVLSSAHTGAVTASSAAIAYTRARNNGAHIGCSATTGDFDGDGITDLVSAGEKAAVSGNYRGGVYLLSGPLAGGEYDLNNSDDYDGRLYGYASQTYYGASVTNAGDVNGDGKDDLLVGSPKDYSALSGSGAAFLYLSPWQNGISYSVADAFFYGGANEEAGWSVSAAGDLDGSGKADWVVGVVYDNPIGLASGAAYILLDAYTGTYGTSNADGILAGEGADDMAGWSTAGAGDTDGDLVPDLLIGAPEYDYDSGVTSGAGHAYLLTGLTF
jgi:hypothetical protein